MNILLLIFVPKIRFHYRKVDSSKINIFVGGYAAASHNAQKRTSISHGEVVDDYRSNEHVGERILTTLSASDLAKQVYELQKLLQDKEQLETSHLPDCNCNCKDRDSKIMS